MLKWRYRSRNLIGPYHFWCISPKNSTLFTIVFLTGKHMQAGDETNYPNARPAAGVGETVTVVNGSLLVAEGGGHQLTFRRFKFRKAAVNPLRAASLGGEMRVVLRAHGLLVLSSVSTYLHSPPLVSSVKAGLPMIH